MANESEIQGIIQAAYFTNNAEVVAEIVRYDLNKTLFKEHPWLVIITLHTHARDEKGLSKREEKPFLEKVMFPIAQVAASEHSKLTGRINTQGKITHYFYAMDGKAFADAVALSAKAFPEYKIEVETKLDAEWGWYLVEAKTLVDYKTERTLTMHVLKMLHDRGDALTQPREYNHIAQFMSPGQRQRFHEWAVSQGFKSTPHDSNEKDPSAKIRPFSLALSRVDIPDWNFLSGTIYDLVHMATKVGGRYSCDGCLVVKQTTPKGE